MSNKRVVIVGGVAGGASAATRIRRMDEGANIVMFDRGHHVSFANCGLPYYVGGVIKEEERLLMASPELFAARFRIDVRTRHEVLSIDRDNRTVRVRDLESEREWDEPYDALVLSPGASPIRPPLPGIDRPGIFTLRSIPDSRAIREWLESRKVRSAVVVGAGFIGLEMAENLAHRGLAVTIVEKAPQVLPAIDEEMAAPVSEHLRSKGIVVHVGDGLRGFAETPDGGLVVETESGARIAAGVVILALGVRPETTLAREAGLRIGTRGGVSVDSEMRTSDPHIWAVGDAVEHRDASSGTEIMVPLAGPGNRQGRIAADSITGRPRAYRGTQATAVVGVFGLTVATTGATERALQRAQAPDYQVVYLHPGHHASYYPGAKTIHLKVLYNAADGKLLGAQAVGEEGVEKRIDAISMAIQLGGTVFDLEEAELCYAPQFGSARDPVNMAGMVGANAMRGISALARWSDVARLGTEATLLDVREPSEFAQEHVVRATNIPLPTLRARIEEVSRTLPVLVYCGVGQRAHVATRILREHGYDARNLSGGIITARYAGIPLERASRG